MRIAFITFEYPPYINGGAGVYAEKLTSELADLGHEIFVFTPQITSSNEIRIKNNLKIIPVNISKILPFKALQFWINIPKYIKNIEQEKNFDIIHVNGISYWFIPKKLSKAPHIVTIHHLVKDTIKLNNMNLFSRLIDLSGENNFFIPILEKRCIKYANLIITDSNFTKEQIIYTYKINQCKIRVVYLGINLKQYTFTDDELNVMKKKLCLPEKPILLFVGRINDPRKGLDLLLEAFKMVLSTNDIILLVVGSGDIKSIKDQIKLMDNTNIILKNIVFTGYMDELSLKKCYSLCDIYICPSRLEGFGLTILEAMQAKKPIIATNIGAIPELIKNNQNGSLIESGDINSLANSIIYYLTNKALCEKIGNNNILYAENNYSWSKCGFETQNLYKLFYEK
jgi:alpha-maltose-1-phosphate synthase